MCGRLTSLGLWPRRERVVNAFRNWRKCGRASRTGSIGLPLRSLVLRDFRLVIQKIEGMTDLDGKSPGYLSSIRCAIQFGSRH